MVLLIHQVWGTFSVKVAKSKVKGKTETSKEIRNLVKRMCSKLRTKLHEYYQCRDLL